MPDLSLFLSLSPPPSVFSVLLVFLQVLSKFPKILPEFPLQFSSRAVWRIAENFSYSPFSSSSLSVFFKFFLRSPFSSLQDPPRPLLSVPPCLRVKQSPMEKGEGSAPDSDRERLSCEKKNRYQRADNSVIAVVLMFMGGSWQQEGRLFWILSDGTSSTGEAVFRQELLSCV